MPPNSIDFAICSRFGYKVSNFLPNAAQKVACPGTVNGDSGAGLTLHHHSLDPYRGHGLIQQHHILSHASKQHQFCSGCGNVRPKPKSKVIWDLTKQDLLSLSFG
jgi:hypothetical protein